MTMEKKEYMKPTMDVTVIHHRSTLLAGSLKSVKTPDKDVDLEFSQEPESSGGGLWGGAW